MAPGPVTVTKREMVFMMLGAATSALAAKALMSGKSEKKQEGLKEFSVVYTDRALNMMSSEFVTVMQDISATLKEVYHASHTAIIPGAGTYAMEAVARQFGKDKKVMVIRNGYFSYRWSDIFTRCHLPEGEETILKAYPAEEGDQPQYIPMPIEKVLAAIKAERPAAVFAPHVETSVGMILPDEYIKSVAAAVHEVGGVFVIDCIASGTIWLNMKELGIDALISAPQKGWSGPCCVGIVALSERGYARVQETDSNSMVTNLKMWCHVMSEYEAGRFKYYTTLPTDALRTFRDVMMETKRFGFEKAKEEQWRLGRLVRSELLKLGFRGVPANNYQPPEVLGSKSVAATNYQAPGVIVLYIPKSMEGHNFFQEFKAQGVQIAGGVPWKIGEPQGRGPKETFRIGLFGLDKIMNVESTVESLIAVVKNIVQQIKLNQTKQ